MILSAGCAGVVAAAGPFIWGCGVSARLVRLLGILGRVGLLIGCIGPAVRWPGWGAIWRFGARR